MCDAKYFAVDPAKIDGLRALADAMNFNELAALVALFGLRSTQECNMDLIESGELDLSEIRGVNTVESMTACASDMMTDMLNEIDLTKVIEVNGLAQPYVLDVQATVVVVRKNV
jgi:hypothetical protein